MIETVIRQVEAGSDLDLETMASTVGLVIEGRCDEEKIARLLLALRAKGETVAEIAGAAIALRAHMTVIRTSRTGLIDTCGTGGDGSKTFNISTAAALVTAAAGVPVAKHGNRGITSRSGSADALRVLGVEIEADVSRVEACLDRLGICFCFAPLLHTAMRHVAPVRRKLGVPTIFNILGPLTNPARAEYQLLGVGKAPLQPLMAEALTLLGIRRGIVVHGSDGLDEVTLAGATRAIEASAEGCREFSWMPGDFGLSTGSLQPLQVDGPEQSAATIQEVLKGQAGPARDIVVANAAAALWTAGKAATTQAAAKLAAEAIDSQAAAELLARLVEQSRRL